MIFLNLKQTRSHSLSNRKKREFFTSLFLPERPCKSANKSQTLLPVGQLAPASAQKAEALSLPTAPKGEVSAPKAHTSAPLPTASAASTDVLVPTVGESITEGILLGWKLPSGGFVEKDGVLFELETIRSPLRLSDARKAVPAGQVQIGQKVASSLLLLLNNTRSLLKMFSPRCTGERWAYYEPQMLLLNIFRSPNRRNEKMYASKDNVLLHSKTTRIRKRQSCSFCQPATHAFPASDASHCEFKRTTTPRKDDTHP